MEWRTRLIHFFRGEVATILGNSRGSPPDSSGAHPGATAAPLEGRGRGGTELAPR